MNERIRELVRQAGLDDADFPIEDWDNVPLARYTELIVKECADIAYNKQYKHSSAHTRGDCAEAIKQHFGVEE